MEKVETPALRQKKLLLIGSKQGIYHRILSELFAKAIVKSYGFIRAIGGKEMK